MDDPAFAAGFRAAKLPNKRRLVDWVSAHMNLSIDPASLFDVQIKRMHEYKRQLLNVLHVVTRYNRILAAPDANWVPRTLIFAGKAASAYNIAKQIIHLINDVATKVNNDPRVGDRLQVVLLPNYSVSLAELVIPAADLSEQISAAGTEAIAEYAREIWYTMAAAKLEH